LSASFLKLYVLKYRGKSQLGVIISRHIKGAVRRNRYKRLIREFFRINQYQIKTGTKIVVVVFKNIIPDSYATVEKEIKKLLEKADKR